MGGPMKPLRWTSKSLRNIASSLNNKGRKVSHKLVGEILKKSGYSLHGSRKTDEGNTTLTETHNLNLSTRWQTIFYP